MISYDLLEMMDGDCFFLAFYFCTDLLIIPATSDTIHTCSRLGEEEEEEEIDDLIH